MLLRWICFFMFKPKKPICLAVFKQEIQVWLYCPHHQSLSISHGVIWHVRKRYRSSVCNQQYNETKSIPESVTNQAHSTNVKMEWERRKQSLCMMVLHAIKLKVYQVYLIYKFSHHSHKCLQTSIKIFIFQMQCIFSPF